MSGRAKRLWEAWRAKAHELDDSCTYYAWDDLGPEQQEAWEHALSVAAPPPSVSLAELSALLDRCDLRTFTVDRAIGFAHDVASVLRRLIEERLSAAGTTDDYGTPSTPRTGADLYASRVADTLIPPPPPTLRSEER